jgi:hypothetical protein
LSSRSVIPLARRRDWSTWKTPDVNPRAGLGSTFPEASMARTTKLCGPESSGGVVNGDAQDAKVGVESVVSAAGPESVNDPRTG